MSKFASAMPDGASDPVFRARHALLKRLADVVSLPASRIICCPDYLRRGNK